MPNQFTDLKNSPLEPNKKITIAEANAIVNRIHDEQTVGTETHFYHTFFYEFCPLLSIAEYVGNEATLIALTKPQSRFDGLIIFAEERTEQKMEFTIAIDGRNDALMMDLLDKRGEAPAFQKIQTTGTKHNRVFEKNESYAIESAEYDQGTLIPLLDAALARKVDKAKTNPDYDGAWLGIVFDDWICPIVTKKKERFDPLCRQTLGRDAARFSPFSRTFFIGVSLKYVFDSYAN